MKCIKIGILSVLAQVLAVGCGDSSPAAGPSPESVGQPTDPSTDAGAGADGAPGTDPGIVSPGSVGPAVDAFDAALAGAVCQRLATCCSSADFGAFFQQYSSPPYDLTTPPAAADCVATLTTQLGKLHKKWAASAEVGRITFSATRGQACVLGISSAACGVPLANALFDAACFGTRGNEVFTKVTPIGAACNDIKDGTFYGECDPKLGFCGSAGTCEAWRKPGEDCGVVPTRMFCAPSLACEGGSSSTPGKCSAEPFMRKVGEPCGAFTGPLELCGEGTYCDDVTSSCTATKPDGAACKSDEECTQNHPYSCSPFGGGTCGSDTFCHKTGSR